MDSAFGILQENLDAGLGAVKDGVVFGLGEAVDLGPLLGRFEAVEGIAGDRVAGGGELDVDVGESGDVILTFLRHQRSHFGFLGTA